MQTAHNSTSKASNRRVKTPTSIMVHVLLKLLAAAYNYKPGLKQHLRTNQGWLDLTVGLATENRSVEAAIAFKGGKVTVQATLPEKTDVTLIFLDDKALRKLITSPPTEQLNMMLKNRLRTQGSISALSLFFYLLSIVLNASQIKQMAKEKNKARKDLRKVQPKACTWLSSELRMRSQVHMKAESRDPGVHYLNDPYLPEYKLHDFPRLERFLDIHFTHKPEICAERPKILTRWYQENGFEMDNHGKAWIPELRQAHALRHLMARRRPIIREGDLIAGTTTEKEIGVVVYPDGSGTWIWSELLTVPHRPLNPYNISDETRRILHHEVFPYWMHRNFREWVRDSFGSPLSQAIDERFAAYFNWKQAAISHTIPDFPKILRIGTKGMIKEIEERLAAGGLDEAQEATLQAMVICLEGLTTYALNLSIQAQQEAASNTDPGRASELKQLADICGQVPEKPARTLDEAVNAIWITWVALHMENSNNGLSLGRLDQWLQPYFIMDIENIETEEGRESYIRHAVELIGCFFMRCTDHLPLTPDMGNWLFGGSSSDQAITLGGITPAGQDGVNDMTYIFLKVTEMLSLRDPNVNARFHPGINSRTYLKRLCEVNLITAATPSLHNDEAMFASLEEFDYEKAHLRDWSATGCVEPTLSGRHIGHTNFQMMNMVAAFEMALNNGRHPLMNWKLGPDTGNIESDDFKTFDSFFDAFCAQLSFLVDMSIEYNEMLGRAHQFLRPTPLLSSLIEGCIAGGKDLTKGGALYNSSGGACIGLADVTDSLMVIKKLVFDEKRVRFSELKRAVDSDFVGAPALHALVMKRVPFFGSGSSEALAMANRVTKFVHDCYGSHTNYRGGKYTVGFWSMANHVAFGTLTGALPSGRQAGKPFTPGLTPEAGSSRNLLDNIRDVAGLDPRNMNNNIAFNVKVIPGADESREKVVDTMCSYASTYFDLGGMQMQMNVVSSAMLRDAMAHPEEYRNLIVRISGYNAYFVTLNPDMQLELIERAEYGMNKMQQR